MLWMWQNHAGHWFTEPVHATVLIVEGQLLVFDLLLGIDTVREL